MVEGKIMEIKNIYDFAIKFTETVLNYGALGLAFGQGAFMWWHSKNHEYKRIKK